MRIFGINNFVPTFKGQRQDRKTVSQLKEDNKYALNLPNQRKINKAIESLSEISGKENVDFLVDVAENLKYGTHIDLGKKSYNDWEVKLYNAAQKSLEKSDKSLQEEYKDKIINAALKTKPLSKEEKEIIRLEQSILNKVDFQLLNKQTNLNIKNVKRNLDYFVISSEVPTSQKIYILKRLNHFMSDKYEINPQLKDKKSIVLAEIVNDIVVDTPESKIPNIKAINQNLHGMCAAISMARKGLAYEDKQNYVDSILSELDNSDYLMVYDISKLGQGKKIPIQKIDIDYDYALSKGYRIVDTSALNWMAAGDLTGLNNETVGTYKPFDKNNFDAMHDSHLQIDADESMSDMHNYYRAQVKAKSAIGNYKKRLEKEKYQIIQKYNVGDRFGDLQKYNNSAIEILKEIAPQASFDKLHRVLGDISSLEAMNSETISKAKGYKKDFMFIINEEPEAKAEKIKAYLAATLGEDADTTISNEQALRLLNITNEIQKIIPQNNSGKRQNISNARALYEAASLYRYQKIKQFSVRYRLENELQKNNIPDSETVLKQNISKIINKLKNNNLNPIVQAKLAQNLGIENEPSTLLSAMEEIKDSLNYIVTDIFDDIYAACCAIDRKEALIAHLKAGEKSILEAQTTEEVEPLAQKLGLKPNRLLILSKIHKYIETLSNPKCSDEEYTEIFNSMGLKSQLFELKETLEKLGETLFQEQNENVIKGFNILNGLNEDAPIEHTRELYQKLARNFNNISEVISSYENALTIEHNDEVLNAPTPELLLLKKYESQGILPTYKELVTLQNRFTKIDSARMKNEFGETLNYKDLPKELTTLTPYEKAALNKYKKNINHWYSEVSRNLISSFEDIKPELEELNREVGVKTGDWWVPPEGNSGLYSNQEVRIYEQMTDRPYYIESNSKRAISKLKDSPYSGISSTSVDHTVPAMHAQYIADISPVKILNSNGETEEKEAIFHDNTWGAIEHRNSWVDTKGLTRTDYSNAYGGALGYITNEKYLNGNLLENILNNPGQYDADIIPTHMYKKLSKGRESYKFSMMPDIITPGKDPSTMDYVRQIRQNLLLPAAGYLEELTDLVKNMDEKDLESAINRITHSSGNARQEYNNFMKRIEGDNILNKGIKTLEDYNKLSDNDKLKLFLEKVAILKTYNGIPELKNFYQTKNLSDLNDAKNKIRIEARKNFDYAFGKNIDIVKYAAESSRSEIYDRLKTFATENHINLKPQDMSKIVNAMKKISPSEFDGNIKKTITLMLNNFENSMNSIIPDSEKIEKNNLTKDIRKIIEKNMEITPQDIKKYFSGGNITDWVDKNFNPKTDEEFIDVLNKLRNMTTKEFQSKYNSLITDKELGIKDVSGYDVLVQLRAENSTYKNALLNTIYSQIYYNNADISKTSPMYDYNKYTRKLHGAKYIGKRTFDDLYIDYYYSLQNLTLEKEFDKIKQQSFEKYGVLPAYPKIELISEDKLEETISKFFNTLNDEIDTISAYKNQILIFNIIHDIQKKVNKNHRPDGTLTPYQYNYITDKLSQFAELGKDDDSITDIVQGIQNILQSKTKAAQDYKTFIDDVYKKLEAYEKTAEGNSMQDAMKESEKSINISKKFFIYNSIDQKHQDRAMEIINKYINARAKANETCKHSDYEYAENLYYEFRNIFDKHRITCNPQEVLNTYLKMNTKNNKYQKAFLSNDNSKEAENLFNTMKDSFETNLVGLLHNANILDLQTILMDCAQEGNLNMVQKALKESTLEFKDGSIVPLNSSKGLQAIITPLLTEDSLDSAEMFINQFGFGDEAIKMISDNTNFTNAKILMKKIYTTLNKLDKQAGIAKDELEKIKAEDINNAPNYMEIIEKHRNNLIKRLGNIGTKISREIYEAAMTDAINKIKQYPNASKEGFIETYINQAIQANSQIAGHSIEIINNSLNQIGQYERLITQIQIAPDSQAEKIRQKYIENCDKLIELKNTFNNRFDNVNITVN